MTKAGFCSTGKWYLLPQILRKVTATRLYCPVSQTSICCKLAEHIIHSNAVRHLDNLRILTDSQHGFRKHRSCETQLILTVDDLSRIAGILTIQNKWTPSLISARPSTQSPIDTYRHLLYKPVSEITYTVSSGTLNSSIPYHTILYKLDYYCIRGSINQWIDSLLTGRTQCVWMARLHIPFL